MKILLVSKAYAGQGGAEAVIKLVTSSIAQRGVTIKGVVLSSGKNNSKNFDWLAYVDYILINFPFKSKTIGGYYYSKRLASFLRKTDVDLILATDEVCVQIADKARNLLKRDTPVISWPHISITVGEKKLIKQLVAANGHLAISDGIAKQLLSVGVPPSAVDVVYNPVARREPFVIPFGFKNFVFIGRFKERHKQVSHILKALLECDDDIVLHLLGDGPDKELYLSFVEKNNLQNRVVFHGYQQDVWKYIADNINNVAALLLASRKEGLPMVLLEAMSRGVYCISSDCDTGPRDIIQPGVNGDLFPVGDVSELTRLMKNITSNAEIPDQDLIIQSVEKMEIETYTTRLLSVLEKYL